MKHSRQHAYTAGVAAGAVPLPTPPQGWQLGGQSNAYFVPNVVRRTALPPSGDSPQVAPPGMRQVQMPAADPRGGGFNGQLLPTQQPVQRLTVATQPDQIYGCCGLFDLCGDADLISLSLAGMEPFMDWIGWEATAICKILKNFVTWARPDNSGASTGYVGDPCADGNGIEWGDCDFQLTDFGLLRRTTPTRNLTRTGLRLCETQPRYRLDGTPITDDMEFDMRIVTEVLMQDLKRLVITGNKTTPGQFDGFERLVNTGYVNSTGRACRIMDSIVIDWNANTFDGGSGVTWNGAAVASTFDFIDVLLAAFRRIIQRIRWAPSLSAALQVGDIAFVAPTFVNQCLLDAFTCWRVCPGGQYTEANLNSLEAREFRANLDGGLFGAGRIFLDGFEVPLINYDWGTIKGPTRGDGYLLTRSVGSVRLINGQYNDMRVAQAQLPGWYDVTDGGRLLTWVDTDNTCFTRSVEMDPRLLLWAPWAQARFQDLKCSQPGGFISPDPTETSFFPETSFSVANC